MGRLGPQVESQLLGASQDLNLALRLRSTCDMQMHGSVPCIFYIKFIQSFYCMFDLNISYFFVVMRFMPNASKTKRLIYIDGYSVLIISLG